MSRYLLSIVFLFCCPALAQYTPLQVHEAVRQAGGAEAFIAQMASDTSKTLPMMTNQNVEIISVAAHGNSLAYLTRIVNVEKNDVYDLQALKDASTNYYGCNSPVLGVLIRDYDVSITYNVVAKGTEYLFQYKLDKASCSNK